MLTKERKQVRVEQTPEGLFIDIPVGIVSWQEAKKIADFINKKADLVHMSENHLAIVRRVG